MADITELTEAQVTELGETLRRLLPKDVPVCCVVRDGRGVWTIGNLGPEDEVNLLVHAAMKAGNPEMAEVNIRLPKVS